MTIIAILFKASVLLATAALAQILLGKRLSATSRHLLWTLAIASLLVLPVLHGLLPAWTVAIVAPSPDVTFLPTAESPVGPLVPEGAPSAAAPAPAAATDETPLARARVPWSSIGAAIYGFGVVVVLIQSAAQWWSVRGLVRRATRITDPAWTGLLDEAARSLKCHRPVVLLRGLEETMPMAFGTRRPAIVLPAVADTWSQNRRRTVLLHELAHVARHDCLTQSLAAIACSVYWVHPGVWWVARRLRIERELACDDRVLAAGSHPDDYAKQLLELAYSLHVEAAPALAVTMAAPQSIEGRLRALLDTGRNRRIPALRSRAAAAAIATALVGATAAAAFGQGALPAFEAADVHVSTPSASPTMRGGALRNGRYEIRTATMVDLVALAYDIEPDKVLGGPNWLDWTRFDVLAKAPQSATQDDLRLMLQRLLADRFALKARRDTSQMPAFALSAGRAKHKMKAGSGGDQFSCGNVPQERVPGGTVQYLWMSCRNITMAAFANVLQDAGGGTYLADPVVDHTGLTGTWDLELKWTPRPRLAQAGADGISLFDAIDKQLGLKLEAKRAPLPVLRIEGVNETPTPNAPGVAATIPTAPMAEFEVVSIRPSASDAVGFSLRGQNGRLDLLNVTVKQLIQFAWDLGNNDDLIVGLPKSATTDRFVVTATVAVPEPGRAPMADEDTLRLMLQGLLAKRFGLKVHMQDRPVEAHTLTVEKQTKLRKADPQNRTHCKSGAGAGSNPMLNRGISCQNMSMTQLAAALPTLAPNYVSTPVKDATGLDGYWDFSFNFSAVSLLPGNRFDPNGASGSTEPTGAITLQDALQRQLGLRLNRERRPLPVLVVDQVDEKPTEN
jgi:uncharacterized protein (TIGR03435 family)